MSLSNYIRETKAEMKHVNWLNREQLTNFTILVIMLSIACGLLLGGFDAIFTYILNLIISSR
jgi:preprotein translocase SecE subunit